MTRPCLTCGRPTNHGPRCPDHTIDTRRAYNSSAYQHARATLLATATRCAYCGAEPTPDNPLTADHETPLIHGGQPDGPLVAACLRCNSRRGATTRAA